LAQDVHGSSEVWTMTQMDYKTYQDEAPIYS